MLKKIYDKSSKIILIMALLLPFLDIYKGVVDSRVQLFGISVMEILNFTYVTVLLLLLLNKLVQEKQKIFSFKYLFLIFLFGIYDIVHYLYLPLVDIAFFNSIPSFFIETYFIIRSYILPLLILFVYLKSDIKKEDIISTLSLIGFIYSIVIVLTNIFGLSFVAYQSYYDSRRMIDGGILSWFTTNMIVTPDLYTSRGWFYSTNQISAILGSLLFISAFYAVAKDEMKYYISFLVKALAALMISTKTAFFAIIFSIMSVFIYQVFIHIFYKKKEYTKKSLSFIVILVVIFGLFMYSPAKYKITNYFYMATDDSFVEVDDSKILKCMSHETIYLRDNYSFAIKDILKKENITYKEMLYVRSFMKDCPESFRLAHEFTDFYTVDDNFDFWFDLIKKPVKDMTNYRTVKKNIYKDFLKVHNNPLDILLGIGYSSNFIYLESDFYAQMVWFGIIGVILFVIPFVIAILKRICILLFHLKSRLNSYTCAYLFAVLYMLFASVKAGHVFGMFVPSAILALLIKGFDEELKQNYPLKDKVTFLLLHLGYGGIETSTINTTSELSKYYDIEIISFYKLDKNQSDKLDKKIKVKYLYDGEPNREEVKESLKKFKLITFIKEGFKSVKILILKKLLIIKTITESDSKYIVSTRNEYTVLLSKYGRSDAIKIAQEHMHHNNRRIYVDNIRHKFKNIDYLFALTKSLKKDYEEFLKNNHHTKVLVVPNMIDMPKAKSNLKSKNLITISRLHPGKKIDELIEIFSKIKCKDNKLYIVGDGSEYEKLKALVYEKGLEKRVILTGYKTKEEIAKYIKDSSLFAMTSISEGLPMVLLEAMSYGVPCIAYMLKSGIEDIITDKKDGYIIHNRSEKNYIKKIDEILSDSKKLNEFGEHAKEKAKMFSNKEVIKIWLNVLK